MLVRSKRELVQAQGSTLGLEQARSKGREQERARSKPGREQAQGSRWVLGRARSKVLVLVLRSKRVPLHSKELDRSSCSSSCTNQLQRS